MQILKRLRKKLVVEKKLRVINSIFLVDFAFKLFVLTKSFQYAQFFTERKVKKRMLGRILLKLLKG